MRNLKVLLLSMVVIGLMAGSAHALTWTGTNQTVAIELVDPNTGLPLTQSVTQIQYTVVAGDLPYINGQTISFTLINGTFQPGTAWNLRLWRIDGGGNHSIVANVFGVPSDNFVQFNVPAGGYAAGDTLYVAYDGPIPGSGDPPRDVNLNLAGTVGVGDNFQVRVRSIAPLPGGTTLSTDNLYTTVAQFAAAQAGVGIRTVDIAKDLKRFTVPPDTEDGLQTRAIGSTTLTNTPPTIPVTDLTGATVTFTLEGPMRGIATNGLTLRNAGGVSLGSFTIVGSTATLTIPLTTALTSSYLQANVDGTTPLAPRQIRLTSVMLNKGTSPQIKRDRALLPAAAVAFNWNLNGLAFRVSYLRDDPPLVTSVIRIEGVRETATRWFVWVTDNAGVEQVFPLTGLSVGPGQMRLISAADILSAAATAGFTINRTGFGATIVYDSKSLNFDDWNIYATQYVAGGYRNLPVQLGFGPFFSGLFWWAW